jgi:uncharacterized protein YbjT (DUF2867 family)
MTVLVLGAGGLIGNAIATDLMHRGLSVVAAARRFTRSQRSQFGHSAREFPIVSSDSTSLTELLRQNGIDVVVNCLGILQDAPGESANAVHLAFVEKLLAALRAVSRPTLLVHLSIPGAKADDRTHFAQSKRDAERAITESGVPFVILRPGFVFAPAAYGGSAMIRALAALPIDVPAKLSARPFAVVAVEDISETVDLLARNWRRGERDRIMFWDLMHPDQTSLGATMERLRGWLGGGRRRRIAFPMVLLRLGAWVGDFVSTLGWRPPLRSTSLAELQRGVAGDPGPWIAGTGIVPRPLEAILKARPATVQERWFARLYLLKALIIATLAVFWCASAVIVLVFSFKAAIPILTAHGYTPAQAKFMTAAGSIMDFCVGLAIAVRRTSRWGLVASVVVSLFYMVGAAILTPELWLEPLGALVKTGPAIVLMLVALAISEDR